MPFDGQDKERVLFTVFTPSPWDRILWILPNRPKPVILRSNWLRPIQPTSDQRGLTLQALNISRALIEDERDWIQRIQETRDGRRCAFGALRAACRLLGLPTLDRGADTMMQVVAKNRFFINIENLNDNSTHKQVLSAFDEAIGRARRTLAAS